MILDEWFEKHISTCPGFWEIPLNKPSSLEANIGEEDYHRLAVAWGLSHESFDIGDYGRPSEIDDVPSPPIRDIEADYISKDMV